MASKQRDNFILGASIIGLIIVGLFFYFAYLISSPVSSEEKEKEIIISKGAGSRIIADDLTDRGLIKNKTAFLVYTFIEGVANKLQAGTYTLSPNMSTKEIVLVLSQGKLISNERTVKILEGWSNQEIGEYLEKQEIMAKEDFLTAASVTNSKEILPEMSYPFLADKKEEAGLEGYLFPDTYRVYKDSRSEDMIKKMLDNFNDKLTEELREEIKNQGKTVFEIVALASILEKELAKSEDRKMAADLFYRRMEIGMFLQSDATVNYATGKSERQPTYADLAVDSLYNTYRYQGLPPGPMNNPSLDAIKAAIYPTPNEYYYFLHKKDGTTVWSKTGEEHLANKAKYLD